LNPPPNRKLNVAKTILGAFLIPWYERRVFGRALAMPMASIVILVVVWWQTNESLPLASGWIFWGCYSGLCIVIAVICHRIVLLGQPAEIAWAFPKWTWRETRFLGWSVLVWIGTAITVWLALMMVSTIGLNLPGVPEVRGPELMKYLGYAAKVAYWFFIVQFCLIFPAIAVDEAVSLALALRRSKGNGWRLFAVVGALPLCFSQAIEPLSRIESVLFGTLLQVLLGTVLIVVQVVALSLCYQQLAKQGVE